MHRHHHARVLFVHIHTDGVPARESVELYVFAPTLDTQYCKRGLLPVGVVRLVDQYAKSATNVHHSIRLDSFWCRHTRLPTCRYEKPAVPLMYPQNAVESGVQAVVQVHGPRS